MRFTNAARATMAVGVAGLLAAGWGAPVAMAADATGTSQSIRTERAGAYFWDHGDSFSVSDYKKDGLGARAYLTVGSRKYSVYAGGGVNDTNEKDLDIKEGTVWLQLCYTQDTADVKCSGTQKGIA